MTIDRAGSSILQGAINKYGRKTENDLFTIDWAWTLGSMWFTLGINLDNLDDSAEYDDDYSEITRIEFDYALDMLADLKKKVDLLGVLNTVDHWDHNGTSADEVYSEEEYKLLTDELATALLNNDTRYIRNFIQEHKV